MKINVELILECMNELQSAALAKQKYSDYYNGKHAILKNYANARKPQQPEAYFQFPT